MITSSVEVRYIPTFNEFASTSLFFFKLDYIPIHLHPTEQETMRGSQPSLGRTRSSSNARPNHIPLPPNNTNANSSGGFFGRPSGPGTPTSPNGTSSNGNGSGGVGIGGGSGNGRPRTPGSTNPENAPLASPSSPRSSFLPSFMQRSRPRSSTLTRLGSFGNPGSGNTNGAATGDAAVGGGSGGSGRTGSSSGSRPASSRAASANDLGRSVSQPLAASTGQCKLRVDSFILKVDRSDSPTHLAPQLTLPRPTLTPLTIQPTTLPR